MTILIYILIDTNFSCFVEQEWLETLATINPEEVTFIDFVQAGTKLASQLKQEVSIMRPTAVQRPPLPPF